MGDDIQKPGIGTPDFFISGLDARGYAYAGIEEMLDAATSLRDGTTSSGSRRNFHYAISAIKHGFPELADMFIDVIEDKVAHSKRIHFVYWNKQERSKRVMSLSEPLDDMNIMIKEYYRKDGLPDIEKLDILYALNGSIAMSGMEDSAAPLVELITRSRRRQLSVKRPGNLAFEHMQDGLVWDGILADAVWFDAFIASNPRFVARAVPEDYERKYAETLAILGPLCGGKRHKQDPARLAKRLLSQGMAAHFDIVSTNIIVEPGNRRRYIDLEKVPDILVNRYHGMAHTWFDPRRPAHFSERRSGLSEEGLPAALYYVSRQVQRMVSESIPAPFLKGEMTMYARFDGYLRMLQDLGTVQWLCDEFPSLRDLRSIDGAHVRSLMRKARSQR